jgi:hypothetical protein
MALISPADQEDLLSLRGRVVLADLVDCTSRTERHSWSTSKESTMSSVRLDDRFESVESAMDRLDAVYGFALEQSVFVQAGSGSRLIQREVVSLLRGGVF